MNLKNDLYWANLINLAIQVIIMLVFGIDFLMLAILLSR